MRTFRVPVAGVDMAVRLPTGAEDVLLFEAGRQDFDVALLLLRRLATRADGSPINWDAVTVTDLDVMLLRLRQLALGDWVRADTSCRNPECLERVDTAFSIDRYLDHHEPHRAPRYGAPDEDGWYALGGTVTFRIPRAVDQQAAARTADPEAALRRLCIRPLDVPAALRRRAETAMAAIAPSLCSPIEGTCPACGATVTSLLDPVQFILRELRDLAALVYEDVCTIARFMHWSESDILALPTVRRARYAELALQVAAGI